MYATEKQIDYINDLMDKREQFSKARRDFSELTKVEASELIDSIKLGLTRKAIAHSSEPIISELFVRVFGSEFMAIQKIQFLVPNMKRASTEKQAEILAPLGNQIVEFAASLPDTMQEWRKVGNIKIRQQIAEFVATGKSETPTKIHQTFGLTRIV